MSRLDKNFHDGSGGRRNRSRSRDRDYRRTGGDVHHSSSSRDDRPRNPSQRENEFCGDRNESYQQQQQGDGSDRSFHQQQQQRSSSDNSYYGNSNDDNNKYTSVGGSRMNQPNTVVAESKTVMIKGLPSHTTEPSLYHVLAAYSPQEIRLISKKETGECKGFAFVEFHTIEHAVYFMTVFAGSAGDRNASQLIVDNRAVTIEYSYKDRDKESYKGRGGGRGRGSGDNRHSSDHHHQQQSSHSIKADWICEQCNYQNFARRHECFKCSSAKTDTCIIVSGSNSIGGGSGGSSNSGSFYASSDQYTDTMVTTQKPSCYLVLRDLNLYTTEEQLIELFRQYALVKNAIVIRDTYTGMSKGLAYIEFHSIEHASHALQLAETAQIQQDKGLVLKVAFAKESFMNHVIQQMQESQQLQQPLHLSLQPQLPQVLPPGMTIEMMMYNNGIARQYQQPPLPTTDGGIYPTSSHHSSLLQPQLPLQQPPPSFSSHEQQQQYQQQQWLLPPPPLTSTVSTTAGVLNTRGFPPNFELYGGSYVFQAQSGYFYEAVSEFYYCPKSKLYYSVMDGCYYKYDMTLIDSSPFVRFEPPLPLPLSSVTSDSSSSSVTTATSATAAEKVAALTRKPIIISMNIGSGNTANSSKNKTSSSSTATAVILNTPTTAATTASSMGKKALTNINKLESIRSNEDDDNNNDDTNTTASAFAKPSDIATTALTTTTISTAAANNATMQLDDLDKLLAFMTAEAINSSSSATSISSATTAVPPPPPPPPQFLSRIPLSAKTSTTTTTAKTPVTSAIADTKTTAMTAVTTATVTPSIFPPSQSTVTPAVVSTGAVCLLCRRQFATAQQLLRHEKESKLHAENLIKFNSTLNQSSKSLPQLQLGKSNGSVDESVSAAAVDTEMIPSDISGIVSSTSGYRDRASERRLMQGDFGTTINTISAICKKKRSYSHSSENENGEENNEQVISSSSSTSTVYSSSSSSSSFSGSSSDKINNITSANITTKTLKEDVDNPGNQLLRKMGWSEGKGLGRSEAGIAEPIQATGHSGTVTKAGVGNTESVTIVNSGGSGGSCSGSTGNSAYKESLLKAARARYDQVSKQ